MSQINDLSLNERNSITGGSNLHNLTGSRSRFQPVRIKALLNLFESDDEDTEPHDSDDNSDAESLQALPDDDDDDDNDKNGHPVNKNDDSDTSISLKKEQLLCVKSESKTLQDQTGISMKNLTIDNKIVENCEFVHCSQQQPVSKFDKIQDGCQAPRNSSSSDVKSTVLSASHRKITHRYSFNNLDDISNTKGTGFNSHSESDPVEQRMAGQSVLSENKFETPRQNLNSVCKNDLDDPCKMNSTSTYGNCIKVEKTKEPIKHDVNYPAILPHLVTETPLKHKPLVTNPERSCSSRRKILETPQNKSHHLYSQNGVETPGIIFSHWSHNNFFQTPTHNQNQILSKKEGNGGQQINQPIEDRQSYRFSANKNRLVRKPLSEAMHLNQGSSIHENHSNHVPENQSLLRSSSYVSYPLENSYNVQSNLLTKENCPMDDKRNIKNNVVDKVVPSLQENQNMNQQSISLVSSMRNNKINCQINLESRLGVASSTLMPPSSTSKAQLEYESILNKNGNTHSKVKSNEFVVSQVGSENRQISHRDAKDKLKLKNDDCNTEPQKNEGLLSISDELKIDLPVSINENNQPTLQEDKSDLKNVQFSVASKGNKKYEKTINVKGTDYLVLGKLGQGMSGEVLRVQDTKTGELRAIKCVDLSCIEKETAQGCLEEVSMLDRLRAPCIINMINYEIKSHLLYVVMEMGDTDLSKLLKSMSREKQLPLTMILYYWTEMLTAVKHIHDNGVIHSDLKPANFLLVRGRLKLIDFGIASTINADMTSVVKNTSLGTLNYISPEAIIDISGNDGSPSDDNKYKINFQSDVWSLGCILYNLVYGQTPFQHIRADWAKVTAITNPNQKISFPPPENLSKRGYTLPPPFLVDVMRRCLQHDRRARPTVSQLLEIPYIGCNCPPVSSLPSIPPSILTKIKHTLEEHEWRKLLEALERRKPPQ